VPYIPAVALCRPTRVIGFCVNSPFRRKRVDVPSIPMTIEQLCAFTKLSRGRAEAWIESGLIEPVPGRRREFGDDQIERVRLIRELQAKGVALPQLAGRNLAFPNSERFVIFDGHQLRACRDAEAAIATAARVKRCSVVDLSAIRRAVA
jgi:MerR HTH family regulatory protein